MMTSIKTLSRQLNRYFDFTFVFKFVCLFLAFYYINVFFVQLMLPGKLHSALFVEHFNYIGWLMGSLTHTANFITQAFGLDTFVTDNNILAAKYGHRVIVKWECIGLGIFSFWLAFVLAHSMTIKKKIMLSAGGILAIWLLNCFRIALLLIALERNLKAWKKSWKYIGEVNHHDLFNFACYTLILLMIVIYYKVSSSRKKQPAS